MTDLESAEARAALARERLGSTVETLQAQLDPQVLIRKAKSGVVEGGERAVTASVAAAKRNPVALAGGIALIAAFFGRRHLAATARRLTNDKQTPGRKTR